jgi:hypothetical protein
MVAIFFKCVSCVFFQVFQKYKCFNCLSDVYCNCLYLDVSKVHRVLHLSSPPSTASSLPEPAGHPYDAAAGSFRIGDTTHPSPLVGRAARAPLAVRNRRSAARLGRGLSRGHDRGLVEVARLRWQCGGGMRVWRR